MTRYAAIVAVAQAVAIASSVTAGILTVAGHEQIALAAWLAPLAVGAILCLTRPTS